MFHSVRDDASSPLRKEKPVPTIDIPSRRPAVLAACVILALTAIPAAAQDSAQQTGGRQRELGGHRFVPTRNVADPFVASRFTNSIGFGGARNLEVPIYNYQDSLVGTVTGDLGFLNIDFEYQQQVTDWLAVRGAVGAIARLGVDGFSFAAEGVSTIYGYNVGATGRILRSGRFQLSAALDYSSNALYGVQPLTYLQGVGSEVRQAIDSVLAGGGTVDSTTIRDILDQIDLSQYNAVQQGTADRTGVGLRLAYTAAPWLGFTVATQSGVGNLLRRSDIGIIDVGAAASLDFGQLSKVPIGVALSARYQNANERSSDLGADLTTFGAFISYAARRDLALGLDLSNSSLGQPTGGTLRASRMSVTMTYFF
jgi:hypothetical protein